MRIFSYVLTALVTIFVINVALSFSLPAYRNILVTVRTGIFSAPGESIEERAIAEKKAENDRLIESLERIDRHMETLVTASKTVPENDASKNEPEEKRKILLSGIFLTKIMPEITLKKIENDGFFGIRTMESVSYDTYSDAVKNIKVYAFGETYDTILLHMKLTDSLYTINETDQFFGYSFFLNLLKKDPKDSITRLVISLEGQAIGVEVPRNYYPVLKDMLLKNK